MIRQGEIYWLDLGMPEGSEPGFLRPYLVIQNDLYNGSGLKTTVVVAITTNPRRGLHPGNVKLSKGEAGLKKASVVIVTQLYTVNKIVLDSPIGLISESRLQQVLEGIRLVLEPL